MQTIMLATDFSERSDRALRRAVLLARETGSRIELVHAVDDDRPRRIVDHEAAEARMLLDGLAETLERVDRVSCSTQVRLADPFAAIANAVEDGAVDLLVIGPHRRQILRDAFVGTTAERTIRAVACPVLMVNGPPVGPYRNVLLTTDLSEDSLAALQRFEALRLAAAASRSVLHVFDAPALRLALSGTMPEEYREEYLNEQRAEATRNLSGFMAKVGASDVGQIVRFEEKTVGRVILTVAGELKSDLIVVSTQGKGTVSRMFLGSVAQQVLRDSTSDVLVIPPVEPI
jgi:nucleotide-binding universal stress UspA family protein